MFVELLLKKCFVVVTFGLIGEMAYLQAKGIVTLIGTNMTVPTASRMPRNSSIKQQREVVRSIRTAEPIRLRNAFDSTTGPIRSSLGDVEGVTEKLKGIDDPLTADACEGIQVLIISEFEQPEVSLAVMRGPGDAVPKLRRIGDFLGEKRVVFIGYNPRNQKPAVWFESPTSICQTMLFVQSNPIPEKVSKKSPLANTESRRDVGRVPNEYVSRIQKVSDKELLLDRAVVEKILGDLSELAKTTRVAPDTHDGKVIGFRLLEVRKDGWLDVLGMQTGDRIETINGFDITSPEKALEAYTRLRMADNIKAQIFRRGVPITIEYRIR
jgi:general secretion pathway protein C